MYLVSFPFGSIMRKDGIVSLDRDVDCVLTDSWTVSERKISNAFEIIQHCGSCHQNFNS